MGHAERIGVAILCGVVFTLCHAVGNRWRERPVSLHAVASVSVCAALAALNAGGCP